MQSSSPNRASSKPRLDCSDCPVEFWMPAWMYILPPWGTSFNFWVHQEERQMGRVHAIGETVEELKQVCPSKGGNGSHLGTTAQRWELTMLPHSAPMPSLVGHSLHWRHKILNIGNKHADWLLIFHPCVQPGLSHHHLTLPLALFCTFFFLMKQS